MVLEREQKKLADDGGCILALAGSEVGYFWSWRRAACLLVAMEWSRGHAAAVQQGKGEDRE
jgi:hypothetical protein